MNSTLPPTYCVASQWVSLGTAGKQTPVSIFLLWLQKGTYLPQTYIIHEEMVVSGKVHNLRQLGPFIYHLCNGKDTYRLNRRLTHRREFGLME